MAQNCSKPSVSVTLALIEALVLKLCEDLIMAEYEPEEELYKYLRVSRPILLYRTIV